MGPSRTELSRTAHRLIVALVFGALILTLLQATGSTVEAAGPGPSVPLPGTASVPVTEQTMTARPQDEASSRALHGDQPAGSVGKDGGGTYAATPLAPSATWNVSAQTGDFTWSYPLRMPPVAGGFHPQLALSYASSAVDGRTSSTNNQAGWAGDGWDLSGGFVERTYGGCGADKEGSNPGQQTGDLCWKSDNATASYPGGGGQLILGANGWRAKIDDGSRIERLTGAGNGDDNGEHWRITSTDGTQFYFGSRSAANSTWTVPVFGDDTGEPCHDSTFDVSSCPQAWRWNLDKVVDRHGNTQLYSYQKETNSYGRNLKDTAVGYDRGGWLSQVEFGLHPDVTGPAPARVLLSTANRCVPGSTCTLNRPENFPDVPLTDRCDGPTCKDKYSPTFWTTQRLAGITTQALKDGAYADVDRWTLDHEFPDPGDGEKAALWLRSIVHTGLAGATPISLPPVTFEGAKLANRVHQADGMSPIIRYRITGIVSESGGVTSVNYAPPDCLTAQTSPETNTLRCFPVRWKRPNHAERTDWFTKYVVASVVQSDRISANPQQVTTYEYLDGAAWHYDESEFTPAAEKTWNEFRGFGRVRIRSGVPDDPTGQVTMTESRFHRGMNGDRARPDGGVKAVTVSDSTGTNRPDHDWLEGFGYETTTYLGDSATVVGRTVSDPVWQGPTASRGAYHAYLVGTGVVRTFTTLDGGRDPRVTKTVTSYDDRGLPVEVDDLGDLSTPTDDTCTRTTYVRNTAAWIIKLPSQQEKVAVSCTTTPTFPDHAISGVRSAYDGRPFGSAPAKGDVTRLETLAAHPAAGPQYRMVSTAAFDAHGRATTTADALGRATTTTYTPVTGGPVTKVVTKNPLGHVSTGVLDPRLGQALTVTDANNRKTESAYDALGRVVETWLPNRPRTGSTPMSANYRFGYQVRDDAPTVISTSAIGPNGNYTTSNALYDGLLRVRQVQSPAAGGGRLITDTRYDSQGRPAKTTQPYFNDHPVDTSLWIANDNEVPAFTTTEYDGAGRVVEAVFRSGLEEKWRTSTRYGGDRVHTTPPQGATATTVISDARLQTTELWRYEAATPTGDHDTTKYRYDSAGRLIGITGPSGNVWQYTYDLRGRLLSSKDPDKGTSTSQYDEAGQVVSHTDGRQQTVVTSYDALGRRTSERVGSATGPKLGEWTYDNLVSGLTAKGHQATATSYDAAGHAYTAAVHTYTAMGLPGTTVVTIPDTGVPGEGPLARSYATTAKYNVDGSLASETFPAVGGLPEESLSHTYDDAGRPLRTYGGPQGTTVEYALNTEYTRQGQVQRLHLGEGDKQVWLSSYYDESTGRLSRTILDAEVPRPMQTDTWYSYDPAGNLTSIADVPQDKPADIQCFRYDHLRRLTQAWTPSAGCDSAPTKPTLGGPAPYWQSWTYNTAGSRLTQNDHASGVGTTYDYAPTGHALESVTTNGTTESYQYDAAGHTTVRGVQQLGWTADGRLDKVSQAGRSTEYVYSADGSRLLRRDATNSVLSLGNQEITVNRTTGSVTATRYYDHGGGPVAVRTTAGGLSWLAGDHQGSQQITIHAATQTVTQRRHLPFGGPRGVTPAWPTEQGFVGGTTDPSGLTQIGARPYDPATGRFLAVDPIIDPGDPQQLHGYTYAGNNPVTFSDPTGLYCDSCDFYHHTKGEPSAWSGSSSSYGPPPPPRIEGERGAGQHARNAERANLKRPVLVNGKKLSPGEIQFLRSRKGYRGSNDFTLEDVLRWSTEGDIQSMEACLYLGGSAEECGGSAPDADLGDLLGILYDFTPVADVHHCLDGSESCWWILSNIGPGKVLNVGEVVAAAAKGADEAVRLSDETKQLAVAHVNDSGTAVIGHTLSVGGRPNFIDKARASGASYFLIEQRAWDALSEAEQWAANRHFLDVISARGDRVVLSVSKDQIRPGSVLQDEVNYLREELGYVWVNQWSLRPGKK